MGVYLHGWIEVQSLPGTWLGVIKIQEVLWPDLKGTVLQELYNIAAGSGLPIDVSGEVRQNDPVEDGLTPYHVLWNEVWKIDTDQVGRSWWVLNEMVGALQQQYSADKIRLVFWAA